MIDETADGTEVTLDVDDVFIVSLPGRGPGAGFEHFRPEVVGRAIRLLERGIDDDGVREWFRFTAVDGGEAEIRTYTVRGFDRRLVRDHTFIVKVRRGDR